MLFFLSFGRGGREGGRRRERKEGGRERERKRHPVGWGPRVWVTAKLIVMLMGSSVKKFENHCSVEPKNMFDKRIISRKVFSSIKRVQEMANPALTFVILSVVTWFAHISY